MIYLDYAANTPVDEAVLDAFVRTSKEYTGNPNSPYGLGFEASARLESATREIAETLGVLETEIIYTSGASESNNLAIKGVAEKYRKYGRHIITTSLEHSSVNGAMAYLKNQGYEIDYVALTETGEVDLAHLKELLRPDTVLVSVCTVDSEIGILQPVTKIAQIVSRYPRCVFHTDATQAIGKVPVCLDGIGLATFAPHKFYGLNGSGALIRKEAVLLEPQIHGGISTTPFRSGTPALALAAALQKALLLALQTREERYKKAAALNKRLRDFFKQYPGIRINSTCKSVPFILNLSIPGVKTEKIQQQLSEAGIYVATKSACCAPNTVSRPVYALTQDKKAALSTLRISLSHLTTDEELDIFMERFTEIYRTLEKRG